MLVGYRLAFRIKSWGHQMWCDFVPPRRADGRGLGTAARPAVRRQQRLVVRAEDAVDAPPPAAKKAAIGPPKGSKVKIPTRPIVLQPPLD